MSQNNKIIRTDGSHFIDINGNPVIPHGINMVCKNKELGYIGNYTKEDFIFLKSKGFNIIRLGIFWDAVEPEPCRYNDEYLSKIDNIISLAGEQGIAIYLDMHQDLYGIKFEDGAPEWATLTDNQEHIRTVLWSESYLISPAVQHAFDNFWDNTPASDGTGIQAHYINMWKHVAERYADNPYVIGYDLMNEPFPGSSGAKVGEIVMSVIGNGSEEELAVLDDQNELMKLIVSIEEITSVFEETLLMPFYNKLGQAVRSVDANSLIMFESNYFANAGIPSHVDLLRNDDGNVLPGQAYVPHGYDILVDTESYNTGGNERVDIIFASLGATIERLALPTLIGEWGCYPDASEAQISQAEHLLDLFKSMNIGNTYFDFSHIYDGKIIKVLEKQ